MTTYKAVERKINVLLCAGWTIKVVATKCCKKAEKRRVKGWWVMSVVCVCTWEGGGVQQRWPSCAKWSVVLKQKCVYQQEIVTHSINKDCGPFWLTS